MVIRKVIWIEHLVEKMITKHNVDQVEIIEILKNKPIFKFAKKGNRENENVYAALGQTESGRYLVVFFVYKKDRSALIISARDMDAKERKYYGKH